jgi:hypothetical protein
MWKTLLNKKTRPRLTTIQKKYDSERGRKASITGGRTMGKMPTLQQEAISVENRGRDSHVVQSSQLVREVRGGLTLT